MSVDSTLTSTEGACAFRAASDSALPSTDISCSACSADTAGSSSPVMRSAGAKPSASVARSVVAGVVDRHAGSRGKGARHCLVVGVELRAPQAQDALAARVVSDAGDGLLVDPDGEELLDRSSPQHAERPVLRVDLDDRRLHDAAQHHRQVRRSRAPGGKRGRASRVVAEGRSS
ncbi:hypothetical protein [Streptomyces sp. NPDC017958]|uniref:hypothetical protein n=1 Tax=Streptomyces sp. NPDC017958 TaxID=3365021 RepID=UPI0037A58E61